MKLNNEYIRTLIGFFCYFIAVGLAIILFTTFLFAYFFNDYRFSININMFGEAHIELIVLIVIIALLIYGLSIYNKFVNKIMKKAYSTGYGDVDDEEYVLRHLLYSDDLTLKSLTQNLGISLCELEPILNNLIEHGLILINIHDEFKITENGIKYLEYKEWRAQDLHNKYMTQ